MASPTEPPIQRLTVRVVPNAPRNEIAGWLGDALKVKVKAPAMEGKANEALLAFLAAAFAVNRRDLTVTAGEKSRQKTVAVRGLDAATFSARLAALGVPVPRA